MELTATPPVLVTVTGTMGMGQYGGGVEGNCPAAGVMRRLTCFATAVVVGAAVVGGTVAGVVVGTVVGGT